MNSVIILAAGKAERFGDNKMLFPLFDKPLIAHTVNAFCGLGYEIILVVNGDDYDSMRKLFGEKVKYALGGSSRRLSTLSGLKAVDKQTKLVAIHDGARPYVSRSLIEKCFAQAKITGSAVPTVPISDTIIDNKGNALNRNEIMAVQTPQVFDYKQYLVAATENTDEFTDDSQVFKKFFGKVNYIEGERNNIKITYRSDLTDYSIGYGYDIHTYAKGRKLFLGGVEIPFPMGLTGHSDADVVLHAIMDAMLSSVGEKDIGHQFPNTDDSYKDISSVILAQKVKLILDKKLASVVSLSVAIVAEMPKISPYQERIVASIAAIFGLSKASVSLTATTAESVGEIGEGKAVAARATAIVRKN